MRTVTFVTISAMVLVLLSPFSSWSMIASNTSGISLVEMESEGIRFFLGTSVEVENGEMAYTIQGRENGGWKSKLEWPLESITYIGEIVSIGLFDTFLVNAGFWKAVTDEAGEMEDSDWLYRYFGTEPFVYSESEATVDALQFDINLRYDFLRFERTSLGAILGFSYTRWYWEAGNGYQVSIVPDYNVGAIQGIGITYEEKLRVPYLGLTLSMLPLESSSLGLNIYGLYSSIARCEDEDDHKLRYKLNTGESEGTFFSLGGDVRWQFSDSWSLTGKVNYTTYDLDGEQDQVFYANNPYNPDAPPAGTRYDNIDLMVEGKQVYIGFMLGYEF